MTTKMLSDYIKDAFESFSTPYDDEFIEACAEWLAKRGMCFDECEVEDVLEYGVVCSSLTIYHFEADEDIAGDKAYTVEFSSDEFGHIIVDVKESD